MYPVRISSELSGLWNSYDAPNRILLFARETGVPVYQEVLTGRERCPECEREQKERNMSMKPDDKMCPKHPLTRMVRGPRGFECPGCLEEARRSMSDDDMMENLYKVGKTVTEAIKEAKEEDLEERIRDFPEMTGEQRPRREQMMVSRQDILRLAQRDVILAAYLRLWRAGAATWTETMQCIVSELSSRLKASLVELEKSQVERPPVYVMQVPPMPKEEFQRRRTEIINDMLIGVVGEGGSLLGDPGAKVDALKKFDKLYDELTRRQEVEDEIPNARKKLENIWGRGQAPPWSRDIEGFQDAIKQMDKAQLLEYLSMTSEVPVCEDPTIEYLREQAHKKLEHEVEIMLLLDEWTENKQMAENPKMWWHKIRQFTITLMHAERVDLVDLMITSEGMSPAAVDNATIRELREEAIRRLDKSAGCIEKVAKIHWNRVKGSDEE